MRRWIVLAAGLLMLSKINCAIYEKEQLLTDGRIVLLELAPADPRSLMQGDYMALRYEVANEALGRRRAKPGLRDGILVLQLDRDHVGTFVRFDEGDPLGPEEVRVRYRIREEKVLFATNAFFFQEGDADLYSPARYGEFRASEKGEIVLTGLRDKGHEPLGPR